MIIKKVKVFTNKRTHIITVPITVIKKMKLKKIPIMLRNTFLLKE